MTKQTLINYDAALTRLANDTSFYKVLLESWFEEPQFEKATLEELMAKKDLVDCANYIHKMKGAASTLGAEILQAEAQKLEDIFRQRVDGDIEKQIEIVNSIFIETNFQLKLYYNKI
jgi:HPt (histidine-containing phosphotransfer) domain-containing protein